MGEENQQIIELDKMQVESKKIEENITIIKNALNSSINAIVISNFEGKLMYVNPAFLRMWGYDDDKDVLGRFAVEFWQFKNLASTALKETQKKGSWFGELAAQKKDGKNLNIQVSTSLIRDELDETCGIIASFVDITQQKKLEEALQKSEKRFQDVALCSVDWIWEIDREARYIFASGKVKEILGYKASELIGKTPFEFMPEKEAKHIGEVFKKISFEKKPIVDLENWNQTKQGKKVCLLTSGIPILDENGNLAGYRGVNKDITEHKQAEEKLKETEQKWNSLMENTNDFIIIIDKKGVIGFINKAIPPDTVDQVIGKKLYDLTAPEHYEMIKQALEGVFQTGKQTSYQSSFNHLSGTLWFETTLIPMMKGGEVVGVMSFNTNITERKKSEKALRKSDENYSTLFKSTKEGILISDSKDRILSVNPAAAKMVGYKKPEELLGMSTLNFYAKTEHRAALFEKLKKTGYLKDFEIKGKKKDGSYVCFLVTLTLHKDKKGNILRTEGFFRDITEQKKIEKELVKYRRHLEELVKKRTAELEHTNQELDSVINSASEIIIALNRNNEVTAWNKSVELLAGYKQSEIIGKNISKLHIFNNPGDITSIKERYLNNSYYRPEPLETKSILNTKNGNRLIVRFSISTIKDKKGQYKGCLFIGRDITGDLEAHGKLLMGSCYVVSEKSNKSTITLFTNFTTSDNKGLFITRGDPNSIRNTVSFLNAQAVLLKQNRAKGFENIPDLEGLTTKIKKFTKENKNPVIALDRVDYLITNFSFEQFAKTLYQITDIISENNALLLLHIDPELLDARQMAAITNELQPLPSQKIEDIQLKDELYDILRFINKQNQKNATVSFKKVGKEFSIVDKTTAKRLQILKDEGLIFVKKLGRMKSLNISEKGKILLHNREIV